MAQPISITVPDTPRAAARARAKLWAPAVAALLGLVMLYGVGFASPQTIHNAAHDSRHSLTFPCH